MSRIIRRHFLKEREAAQLLLRLSQQLKTDSRKLFGPKAQKVHVESAETHVGEIFLVEGKPLLAHYKNSFLPTLMFERALNQLPRVVVNMGAVPHICNGADVMAPGVVQVEGEFQANEFILVVDERHRKPLAVGKALLNSKDLKTLKHGKTVKNLHFVGDKLWKLLKQF